MPELHYSQAPITEALIDLRVELDASAPLASLAQVNAGQEVDYPKKREHLNVHAAFSAGGQVSAAASQTAIGYTFLSSDERQIYQCRLNGFTFSRLAPYDRWTTFRNEARRLWEIYRSLVPVRKVTRLAVRYINRLDLAVPAELKQYLRTFPEISSDLPQSIDGFFMQVQMTMPDLPGQLIINQTIVAPEHDGTVALILDIHLFREENVPQDDLEIWRFFDRLRARKNMVFEACITDRTRDLIR